MLEAVLEHVVAHAQAERGVDLGLRLEQRCELAAERPRLRGRALERPEPAHLGQRTTHGRAQPRVAQARRRGCLQVDCAERQRLDELRRARQHVALVVDHDRVPVEDQLVLAADAVAERDRAEVVARALDEHRLALAALAGEVGRGRRVDDQRRAGERLRGGRRPGRPDVLADRQPDAARCRGRARPRRRRPGSSAARRRRRSWAAGSCGRPRGPRRRRAPRASCRRRRRARGSRPARRCPAPPPRPRPAPAVPPAGSAP